VFVVMGFQYISASRLEGFLIIRRSRKLTRSLLSCDGLSCIFVCTWFMYLWMVLVSVHFV
jgi:hypothetical protein